MARHTVQRTELHPEFHAEGTYWSRSQGQNRLIALVQNPRTVFLYWDLKDETKCLLSIHLGRDWSELQAVLRLYDVTGVRFDGSNAGSHVDILVPADADNWYVHNLVPGSDYLAVFGVYTTDRHLLGLLQSLSVHTPGAHGALQAADSRRRLESPSPEVTTWIHQFTGYSLDESV